MQRHGRTAYRAICLEQHLHAYHTSNGLARPLPILPHVLAWSMRLHVHHKCLASPHHRASMTEQHLKLVSLLAWPAMGMISIGPAIFPLLHRGRREGYASAGHLPAPCLPSQTVWSAPECGSVTVWVAHARMWQCDCVTRARKWHPRLPCDGRRSILQCRPVLLPRPACARPCLWSTPELQGHGHGARGVACEVRVWVRGWGGGLEMSECNQGWRLERKGRGERLGEKVGGGRLEKKVGVEDWKKRLGVEIVKAKGWRLEKVEDENRLGLKIEKGSDYYDFDQGLRFSECAPHWHIACQFLAVGSGCAVWVG